MSLSYATALRMAGHMQTRSDEITLAILECQEAKHGVVALIFTDDCNTLTIKILDEPYEDDVRVYRR